jgi:beta-glucanase (GH16 family)
MSKGRLVAGLGDGGFHVFALEWTPDAYRFYVDGQLVWEPVDPPISHRGEFIVLSSEVESIASFSGFIPEGGFGARDESTTRMVVDYVRVYQVVPEPGTGLLGALGLTLLAARRRARSRARSESASAAPQSPAAEAVGVASISGCFTKNS